MSEEPYLTLREFLDRFPLGFPQTTAGIEIKILKRLFTEEEAKIAVLLNPIPETAAQIAKRNKMDEKILEKNLESMAKKGLIFRAGHKNKTFYNSAPFMIGLYEYSVKKIDQALAKLFKEYYDIAYLDEMGASNIPGFKVLPIEKTIQPNTVLYPFQKLERSIRESRKIAVTECICRKESRLTGEGCDYPIETCLSFGSAAEYYIENGMGREITADEAIEIIIEADKAGLVHAGVNSKHLSNLCNCCPCCCASMKGITKLGHNRHKYLNALFASIIDKEKCIGCGSCIDRCPVEAITLADIASVDREKCLGCGLCAGVCPEEAITLAVRKDGEEPFDRVIELGMAILEGKKSRMV
ncbi:MAG TPA: 4Fe-4S binding protein [Candidatus Deferrimicrobium sp.]|nr:4Fe-4S binding protein [Candidatus Deferrimicrobium sp.]